MGELELIQLEELAEEFGLQSLALQCEQLKVAFAAEADYGLKTLEEDPKVEIIYQRPVAFLENRPAFPFNIPIEASKLLQHLESGKFSEVEVTIENHGKVAQAHRLVLSAWSAPFAKVSVRSLIL